MFKQIKQLGSDTAVYGISTIIGRFLNFLLVPFYTNVLNPGEYGIVSYVYSLIAFANVLYIYGLETAFLKYGSTKELGDEKQNFSAPFLSHAGTSLIFSLLLCILTPFLSAEISIHSFQKSILFYSAGILFFDTLAVIPFASLRLERKSKQFAFTKLMNICVNVIMNILLIVKFHFGVEGIFISGLISSVLTAVALAPQIFSHLQIKFNGNLWKALMKFGLPTIPAGIAGMVLQVVDRPILKALTNDETVGIYQANYRLGIFMMLIVSMFDYAWKPFMFSVAQQEDAKQIFARVLTYMTLLMSAVFLFLTFFVEDIVRISFFGHHLINERYWSGLSIVPIVLLGYLFLGIATTLSAGIYIEKKTKYLPPVSMIAAGVNMVVNLLLIPIMGMEGAAWATLIAYFVMAVLTYVFAQRVYPIQYEWKRLIKLVIVLAIVTVVQAAVLVSAFEKSFKVAMIIVFFVLLGNAKFFEPGELLRIKSLFGKLKGGKENNRPPSD